MTQKLLKSRLQLSFKLSQSSQELHITCVRCSRGVKRGYDWVIYSRHNFPRVSASCAVISSALPLFAIPFHRSHLPSQILHFIYLVPSTYCRFLQFSIRFRVAYFMSRRLHVPPLFSRRSRLDVIVMKQMRWHSRP